MSVRGDYADEYDERFATLVSDLYEQGYSVDQIYSEVIEAGWSEEYTNYNNLTDVMITDAGIALQQVERFTDWRREGTNENEFRGWLPEDHLATSYDRISHELELRTINGKPVIILDQVLKDHLEEVPLDLPLDMPDNNRVETAETLQNKLKDHEFLTLLVQWYRDGFSRMNTEESLNAESGSMRQLEHWNSALSAERLARFPSDTSPATLRLPGHRTFASYVLTGWSQHQIRNQMGLAKSTQSRMWNDMHPLDRYQCLPTYFAGSQKPYYTRVQERNPYPDGLEPPLTQIPQAVIDELDQDDHQVPQDPNAYEQTFEGYEQYPRNDAGGYADASNYYHQY